MDEITKIMIDEFEKRPDGSWACVRNSDITTKSQKVIRVTPGMTFKKGRTLWGIDVADTLDKISSN